MRGEAGSQVSKSIVTKSSLNVLNYYWMRSVVISPTIKGGENVIRRSILSDLAYSGHNKTESNDYFIINCFKENHEKTHS